MKLLLNSAILIKRYKRFLADITLPDDSITTIHCANTGAMTGCATPEDTVYYSVSDNMKRKYPFSWELTQTKSNDYICVNTQRANQLVEEALNNNVIDELNGYDTLQREVKYGTENSRIDFLLTGQGKRKTYIEVKSVTLLTAKQGFFPDTVTTRGQKHLRELMEVAAQGHRAVLFFAVLHSGINSVKIAKHIDPKYAILIDEAQQSGVEVLIYKAKFSIDFPEHTITLKNKIPFN